MNSLFPSLPILYFGKLGNISKYSKGYIDSSKFFLPLLLSLLSPFLLLAFLLVGITVLSI